MKIHTKTVFTPILGGRIATAGTWSVPEVTSAFEAQYLFEKQRAIL
jgi:hypothetical protein